MSNKLLYALRDYRLSLWEGLTGLSSSHLDLKIKGNLLYLRFCLGTKQVPVCRGATVPTLILYSEDSISGDEKLYAGVPGFVRTK